MQDFAERPFKHGVTLIPPKVLDPQHRQLVMDRVGKDFGYSKKTNWEAFLMRRTSEIALERKSSKKSNLQ